MKSKPLLLLATAALLLTGCGGPPPADFADKPVEVLTGQASWYHDSLHGNPTASGEPYDRNAMTAAHRTLPFGTIVRVTNQRNGKSVRLRINDRGPFVRGRIIDVSRRAAQELDFVNAGVVPVRVEVLSKGAG